MVEDVVQEPYHGNLPSLKQAVTMHFNKVCKYLSRIPSSDYYGMNPKEIQFKISKNDAYIYLNDLIIMNERAKSNLEYISERSQESQSLQNSRSSVKVNSEGQIDSPPQ